MKFLLPKNIGLALLVVGLILCGFGLSVWLRPPQYRAGTRVKIEPPDTNALNDSSSPVEPGVVPNDFEILQSPAVLSNAITALNLEAKWSIKLPNTGKLTFPKTMTRLKRHLSLTPVRNAKLVKISFISEDPKEAADVPNAIAQAFNDYRDEIWQQAKKSGLKAWQEKYQVQEKQILTMRTNVDELRRNFAIAGDPTGSLGQPYPEAKFKLDQLVEQHEKLYAKIDEQKIYSEMIIDDPMVRIVDFAEPSDVQIIPNRFWGLVFIAIGLVLSLGAVCRTKWRR